jgi:carbon-monoxide dehydrogenase small subunit
LSDSKKIPFQLRLNGENREIFARPADTLLEVVREHLGLAGSKPGCLNGDCGACTVLADGVPMKSCLMLAIEASAHNITTIEGLRNTPIQHAFVEQFAFQCGYCTSGFLVNAHALVTQHPDADDETIREWLSSNICRCTCYEEIEAAVKSCLRPQRKHFPGADSFV